VCSHKSVRPKPAFRSKTIASSNDYLNHISNSSAPQSDKVTQKGERQMHKRLIVAAAALAIAGSDVRAQVDLSSYADAEGFLDVQALTCAQLANTWQGDADMLASWYSGWYNGLAKKHYMDIRKGKEAEHEVIVYCKAHPELRIIQAMDVVFKNMRQRLGIEVK
ncbi:MAG: HdeA/HdeB family chaperone, partial [Pseudolabrys sp.]